MNLATVLKKERNLLSWKCFKNYIKKLTNKIGFPWRCFSHFWGNNHGEMHIFYVLILPRSRTTPYCQPACCLFCLERQNSSPTTSGMRPIPSHHTSPAGRNSTHTLNLSSTSNTKPRAWTPTTPLPRVPMRASAPTWGTAPAEGHHSSAQ